MMQFRELPLNVIRNYIDKNMICDDVENLYKIAWKMLLNDNNPPEILRDYMYAYKLFTNGKLIPVVYRSDVEWYGFDYLKELQGLLNLSTMNVEQIIRILDYLNKIVDTIDYGLFSLPNEIVENILSKMDGKDLIRICSVSKCLNKFCMGNWMLGTIVKNKIGLHPFHQDGTPFCSILTKNIYKYGKNKRIQYDWDFNIYFVVLNERLYAYNESMTPKLSEIEILHPIIHISNKVEFNDDVFSYMLTPNGDAYQLCITCRDNKFQAKEEFQLSDVIQISSSQNYVMFLTSYGKVWMRGWLMHGLMEIFNGVSLPIVQISASSYYPMILTSDGQVYFLKEYDINDRELDKFVLYKFLDFPSILDIATQDNEWIVLVDEKYNIYALETITSFNRGSDTIRARKMLQKEADLSTYYDPSKSRWLKIKKEETTTFYTDDYIYPDIDDDDCNIRQIYIDRLTFISPIHPYQQLHLDENLLIVNNHNICIISFNIHDDDEFDKTSKTDFNDPIVSAALIRRQCSYAYIARHLDGTEYFNIVK